MAAHLSHVVTDGLFARESDADDAPLHFHRAVGLDAERAQALTPTVQRQILRLYVRRGLLTEADAHDMLTWRGFGGFTLDGSVRIAAHDRAGLERLLRYCARPPCVPTRFPPGVTRRTPRRLQGPPRHLLLPPKDALPL